MNNANYESARDSLEASLEQYRRVNNPVMVGRDWLWLGVASQANGDLQRADQYISQSLAIFTEIAHEGNIAFGLFLKCGLALAEGRFDQADEVNEEIWRIAQKTGSQRDICHVLYFRARLARLRGDPIAAQKYAEQGLNLSQKQRESAMYLLLELGYLALQSGELARAGSLWREGIHILIRWRTNAWMLFPLGAMPVLFAREGKLERAAHLFSTRWSHGYVNYLSPIERAVQEADLTAVRAALGEARFEQVSQEGRAMTLEQAVEYALEEHE